MATRTRPTVTITITTDPTTQEVQYNIACHEFGHGLALAHSSLPNVQGPCQNGTPTTWDYDNVRRSHDHFDAGYNGPESFNEGPIMWETTEHPLEFYEELSDTSVAESLTQKVAA